MSRLLKKPLRVKKLKFRPVLWCLAILIGIFGISLKSFGEENGGGGFAVHIASFRDREKAENDAAFFRARGVPAYQEAVDLGEKGTWYRVYAGCSDSREDIKARMSEIEKIRPAGSLRIVKRDRPRQKVSPDLSPEKTPFPVPVKEAEAVPPSPEAPRVAKAVQTSAVTEEKESETPSSRETARDPGVQEEEGTGPGPVAAVSGPLNPPPGGTDCRSALPRLKQAADASDPGSPGRDRLFRAYADCAFTLGLEGDDGLLLSAVDYYRRFLRMRQGAGRDDDLIHYRIARSFEEIGFYYEARGSYETLLVLHPLSVYAEEALFKVAKMMFRTDRYQEALDTFIAYLKRYPDGRFAREAYFSVGVACDRLGKAYHAEIWFRDGIKKWPAYQHIPAELLLDLGNHFVTVDKYDDALSVFTEYASLYPQLSTTKKALFGAAVSLYERAQPGKAVFLFSLVLDRFPESVEADESVLMLARIAGENPGLKLPKVMKGWEVMHDPVSAFNEVYGKHGNEVIAEKALLYKAVYLDRNERWFEAVETCLVMEDLWGWRTSGKEALALLKSGTDRLVEAYAGQGDDISVSALYYRTYGRGWIRTSEFTTAFTMGGSLLKMGDLEEAGKVYEQAFTLARNDGERFKALSSLVDLACRKKDYEKALNRLDEVLAEGEKGGCPALVREKKAEVLCLMGEGKKALSLYEALSGPSWAPAVPVTAFSNFGRSLEEAGKWEKAVEYYDKVLDLCRDSGNCQEDRILEVERRRAHCFFMARQYGEGLLSYEEAVEKEREGNMKLWSLYRIGQGYALSGETGKSRLALNGLKERGEEEFWVSLADWWSYDHQWMNAHGLLLDRSPSRTSPRGGAP